MSRKSKDKTQATIPEALGDPHFAMERGSYDNTVMEKIRNCDLNVSAIKVYMYLARNRDLGKAALFMAASVKRIAAYWNINKRSVYRALADLTDAGLYEPPLHGKDVVTGVLLPKRGKDED